MELCLIADGKTSLSSPRSFDIVCSFLCKGLPVNIYYGRFSLMTGVEIIPRDLARYCYPELIDQINLSVYGHILVFRGFVTGGNTSLVLSDEIVASITRITQAKPCKESKACDDCSRVSRCVIGG